MLGMAAMRSMQSPAGVAIRRGHIGVRKAAAASPMGMPMSMAMAVTVSAPMMKTAPPSWLVFWSHVVVHRKLMPKWPHAWAD